MLLQRLVEYAAQLELPPPMYGPVPALLAHRRL